jgi:hypothetical protein
MVTLMPYNFRYPVFLKFPLMGPALTFFWRRYAVLFAGLIAAALTGACTQDGTAGASRPTVTIGFVEGTPTPTIEVMARGRQLAGAVLVEPSGRQTAAGVIERDTIYAADPYGYGYGPSVGVGVGGGGWNGGNWRGGGIGVGVPLGGGAPPQQVETRMRARITVPDMEAYRRDWERAVVRVTFGSDPANNEIADIPAPAPGGR